MKGFVRYLDKHQGVQPSPYEYNCLIQSINHNYTQFHVGPPPPAHVLKYDVPIHVNRTAKYIDVNITTLQDILTLIDNHPIEPLCDYNIDLQSLHNIKGELETLNNMVGLTHLKQAVVDQLLYFIQRLHEGPDGDYKHTVLSGPPGTGKTEVAKLLGTMYSKIGALQNTGFKKVTRADLIAGYLGQTAIKTQKVIEASLGGVLFLDEAYSLSDPGQSDMFSKECVDTLCEALSSHKDNLMVIIAGYEEALRSSFFSMNPGLSSRFLWRFTIDAYSPKELRQIFIKKVADSKWTLENPDADFSVKWFEQRKDKFIQFGRDMESLFTYTKIAHGRRIYGKSNEYKKRLNKEDLDKGYEAFLSHKDLPKPSPLLNMYL
jgi:SpoVK/Ycf46/Vps4 family AAA+-type ATPase